MGYCGVRSGWQMLSIDGSPGNGVISVNCVDSNIDTVHSVGSYQEIVS